jgi:hypothetical protein
MPTHAQMMAKLRRVNAAIRKSQEIALAKRKSRAVKKTKKTKSKKMSPIGLKALGIY